MDPSLGLSFPWVEGQGWPSAFSLPPPSLAPWGFLVQGQLSGLTIAVPPSWSRQLGSSVWGLAFPTRPAAAAAAAKALQSRPTLCDPIDAHVNHPLLIPANPQGTEKYNIYVSGA